LKQIMLNVLRTTTWRSTGGLELQPHTCFDLGTRWRWVINFTPLPLYPQGKNPWYPLDRRLVGPRAIPDTVMRKISSSHRESNHRTPIIQPVAQRYTNWVIKALKVNEFNNQKQARAKITLHHNKCLHHSKLPS
jgi:hypothetical protein